MHIFGCLAKQKASSKVVALKVSLANRPMHTPKTGEIGLYLLRGWSMFASLIRTRIQQICTLKQSILSTNHMNGGN